eukprot:1559628-Karenia_brevis.AAC.1
MLHGVQRVHAAGVVHRDVKPSNFLLGGDEGWTVKICDFGLAILWQPGCEPLLGSCGTAPYMSPEMLGEAGYGSATDMWSLGVSVYWMLYGEFPYRPPPGCLAVPAGSPLT